VGERVRNAAERAGTELLSWRRTFNDLRRRIGTSLSIVMLLFFALLAIWWNWEQLIKKPGIDQFVQSVTRFIGIRSADRLPQFAVEFQKFAPVEANANTRYWNWSGKRWEEKTPSGEVMYHDFVSKMSLDGCEGDLTKKEADPELRFFIPHKTCSNMTLRFNFRSNGWQPFGAIIASR
jgi:hypothetical protein